MNLYDIAILSAAAGFTLVETLQVDKRFNLDFKPFTCANCLSGWIAGLLWITLSIQSWSLPEMLLTPFVMCLAITVSSFFNALMRKL